MNSTPSLKKSLGIRDLTLLAVVAVANLNVVPVIAANGATTVWLWLAALVFFFLPQGLAVIELSHQLPGEGGIYIWAKQSFGSLHGFLCGWCYWTSNMFFVPTLLFYLSGIPAYLGGIAEDRPLFIFLTIAILWIATATNIMGLGVGKWVNNAGATGTLIGATVLIVLAVFHRGTALHPADFTLSKLDWQVFGVVCFSLVGLELGSVMGDEIRDPRRTLPRSVLFGGFLAGALYLSATLAILAAVPQGEVKMLQGVLQAIEKMAGGWVVTPVAILLICAIAGSVSAWVGGSARIMFVSGIDRYLPAILARIHPRYGTPYVSLLAFAALSTGMIAMSFIGASVKEAYLTLLDLAVILQMLSYIYLYAALWKIAFGPPCPLFLSRPAVRFAAVSGMATTLVCTVLAFVPSRQIASVWAFEAKLLLTTIAFLAAAAGLFRYYSRQAAPGSV